MFIITLPYTYTESCSCPSSIGLIYSEEPADTIISGKSYVAKYTLTTTLSTVKYGFADVSHANIHSCKKEMGKLIISLLFFY